MNIINVTPITLHVLTKYQGKQKLSRVLEISPCEIPCRISHFMVLFLFLIWNQKFPKGLNDLAF